MRNTNQKFQLDPDSTVVKVIAVIILFTVGFALFLIASNGFGSSKKNTGNWSEEASKECRNRSNTYYKCSWSVIEDRCVCKQR